MVFSAGIYSAASSILETVSGRTSVARLQSDRITKLNRKLEDQRLINTRYKRHLEKNRKKIGELRTVIRHERHFKSTAISQLGDTQDKLEKLETNASRISTKVIKRSRRTATREIAVMPSEAIPMLGTAAIVGSTALEIHDLCQTMKDMAELRRATNDAQKASTEDLTVCSITLPSSAELWATAYSAPKDAWDRMRIHIPDLDDFSMPESISWPDWEWPWN
ncbi:hypothetical protein [Roseivivax marinus]|uniref:hypothetical protein n=1 Tax=Roseivivax marinus TaxID=1379903 RepID=UPI00138DFD41|nr:hypothetical protein [Roseivivax marinus]